MRHFLFSVALTFAHAAQLPVVLNETGALHGAREFSKPAKSGEVFSVNFAVRPAGNAQIRIESGDGLLLASKHLHAGDADFTTLVSPRLDGLLKVSLNGEAASFELKVLRWPSTAAVKREPNNSWQQANPITLGSTLFASADENAYLPLEGPRPKDLMGEQDWYRLEFTEAKPKLVFFQIELMERDHLPVDVSIYRINSDGKPVIYFEGEDPVTLPHEVQAMAGNKFTTRVLKERGTYYVCVRANHPEYKLRTRVYDTPPYANPQNAVRTAVDFAMGSGDSWHANTPRRGGIYDRVASLHQETSLCVACHATHFTQRAQLYAIRNGYPVVQRQQLQFMTERFYNNPRPFYGFEKEGAVWSRMISASANVLSRMSALLGIFESEVTGERRESVHNGVNEYLKIYYADRDKLPNDETNGNTPLVSAHEVAWYSWVSNQDPQLADFIARGEVKNMIDLCYQTLALADMDRVKYSALIAKNAARILEAQRPSGQWAMRFGSKEPEVEFQTGHALWALHAAGVPRENPQVAKGLQYLLQRQQNFGGWMDPLQSYENFRTPFRETQMAVLAVSAYFPAAPASAKGWNTPVLATFSKDPAVLLEQLDNTWAAGAHGLKEAAQSNDAYIRQAAVEAMGRIADPLDLRFLIARFDDSSKLVQRTAAWAVRQIYSRHTRTSTLPLEEALTKGNERTRWGATRVFAQHFAALAQRPGIAEALARAADANEPSIRIQALKGLWQMWFWNGDSGARGRIEDVFLKQIEKPQHPWVERNLQEGIYNIADENIRYFYNNWIPLLGREADRTRVIKGRLAVEARLADKFATVLENGNDHQRKMLLASLGDFQLRHADVYEPLNKPDIAFPPQYNRIGNDVEQIAFFGASAERFSKALLPLLQSSDARMRELAQTAGLLVRPVRFPGVNEVSGELGPLAKEVAERLPKPAPLPATTSGNVRKNTKKLDETYFRGYVQPILEKRGRDGYACVHCHASHAIFDGSWGTAMKVVDTANPEQSLILRKPTSSAESEGVVDSKILSHGGGVRWDKSSPEYLTILEWIKGAVE